MKTVEMTFVDFKQQVELWMADNNMLVQEDVAYWLSLFIGVEENAVLAILKQHNEPNGKSIKSGFYFDLWNLRNGKPLVVATAQSSMNKQAIKAE